MALQHFYSRQALATPKVETKWNKDQINKKKGGGGPKTKPKHPPYLKYDKLQTSLNWKNT